MTRPSRKRKVAGLLRLALICVLALTACTQEARNPNIIFIMADDLGYGDLGTYGQQDVQTPHIDRLADEGMKFTHHYAGSTVCRPSRLSLLTGVGPGRAPIASNAGYQFENDEITVTELLQNAGYATGGIGKWAMGGFDSPGHPNEKGFDWFFGFLNQGRAHNYYPIYLWENEQKVPLAGNKLMKDPRARGNVASQRRTYAPDLMTERMLQWVREHADKPVFSPSPLHDPPRQQRGRTCSRKRYGSTRPWPIRIPPGVARCGTRFRRDGYPT